jgi:hypothetical protein
VDVVGGDEAAHAPLAARDAGDDLVLEDVGALVLTAPSLGSPFFTRQTTLPVLASSATRVLSACCRKTLPSA